MHVIACLISQICAFAGEKKDLAGNYGDVGTWTVGYAHVSKRQAQHVAESRQIL